MSSKYFFLFFLILGLFTLSTSPIRAQNVGIGTTSPTEDLDINGKIRLREDATNNYILQSDATGVATWTKPTNQVRNEICVTDYGAVGDLNTDNAAAFQSAIDAAAVLGGVVCVPPGEYILRSTVTIPGGVTLEGVGRGADYLNFSPALGQHSSMIFYTGVNDWAFEVRGFSSGIKDLAIYNGNVAGMKAAGAIRLMADQGGFETGYNTFSRIFIWNFFEGTAIKMEATNNSTIAHVLFENIDTRFPVTAFHVIPENGSFINNVTFLNSKIGAGSNYGFRNQGGTDISFYGSTFEGVQGCPNTFAHIVIESGNFQAYGVRLEATNSLAGCGLEEEKKIVGIHCFPYTTGSYYYGLIGEGRIVDEGDNEIIVASRGLGDSGYNQFKNSSFQRVVNNTIPEWEVTGSGFSISKNAPEIRDKHHVLTFTIPAYETITLSPSSDALPNGLTHQYLVFGAQIKTSVPDLVFTQINHYSHTLGTCTDTDSSFHPGDGDWHYIGMPAALNASVCTLNPRFVFDNSGNANPATVQLTTPSLVFGATLPSLESPPLLASGGRMNGTISHGMVSTVSMPTNSNSELTLPFDGNLFFVKGSGNIRRLNNSVSLGDRFPTGTIITLMFDSASQFVRSSAYIELLGDEDYNAGLNSSITLVAQNGGVWRELGRNK